MIVTNRYIPNTAEGDYLCIRKVADKVDGFTLSDQSGQIVYTMPAGVSYDEINLQESGAVTARFDTDVYELVRSRTSHATFFMLEQISNNLVAYMQEVKKKIDEYADWVAGGDSITAEDIQHQLFVTFDIIDHELQLTKIDLGRLLGESYTEQDGLTLNAKLNLLAGTLSDLSQIVTNYTSCSSLLVPTDYVEKMITAPPFDGSFSLESYICGVGNTLPTLPEMPIGGRAVVSFVCSPDTANGSVFFRFGGSGLYLLHSRTWFMPYGYFTTAFANGGQAVNDWATAHPELSEKPYGMWQVHNNPLLLLSDDDVAICPLDGTSWTTGNQYNVIVERLG